MKCSSIIHLIFVFECMEFIHCTNSTLAQESSINVTTRTLTISFLNKTKSQNIPYVTTYTLFSSLPCFLGYILLLYSLHFLARYYTQIQHFISSSTTVKASIVSCTRAYQVCHHCLHAIMEQYYYIVLEYKPSKSDEYHDIKIPSRIYKEFCVNEEYYIQNVKDNKGRMLDVHTLSSYPYSGCLDISKDKSKYKICAMILFGAMLLSLGVMPQCNILIQLMLSFKHYWIIIVSYFAMHTCVILLSYWCCNFIMRTRIEALYYETPPLNMIRGDHRQSLNSADDCDDNVNDDGMDGSSIESASIDRVALQYELPILKKEIHFASV